MSLTHYRNFPTTAMNVTAGPGWTDAWLGYFPFPIGEVLRLVPVTGSESETFDDYGIGEYEYNEAIKFSENGTEVFTTENRLVIEFDYQLYVDTAGDYIWAAKTERIKIDGFTVAEFEIDHEYDGQGLGGVVPDAAYYTFGDIWDMVSRFGKTVFDVKTFDTNIIDVSGYSEQYYYNDRMFSAFALASNPITGVLAIGNSLYPGQIGLQSISQPIALDFILRTLNGLGIDGRSDLLNGLGIQFSEAIIYNLGTFIQSLQKLKGTLSGDGIQNIQRILTDISESNRFGSIQSLINAVGELNISAIYPTVSYEIYIDGRPAKQRISAMSIEMSEDSVHNTFSFTSSDQNLFVQCNPATRSGETRVEIHVNSRVFNFLIEERSGSNLSFNIWGRSPTALLDAPKSEEIEFTMISNSKADDVIGDLCGSIASDFRLSNWVIPKTFTFRGRKIDGISQIAKEVEGIVRADDDGTLIIRPKYPIRPVNISKATPVIKYDKDSKLIELSIRESIGTKENVVDVKGITQEIDLPQLEIEDNPEGYFKKEDIYVRAYWGSLKPPEVTDFYTTDGVAKFVSAGKEEIYEEIVTFKDGVANTSKPVKGIQSTRWLGKNGGDVDFRELSTELYISETDARVAKIKYSTVYDRYRISGHNVDLLVFVMVIGSKYDVSVRVKMGSEDKIAPALNKPLLTDNNVAVKAGTAYLDGVKYDSVELDFIAPHENDARDGIIVRIDDPDMGIYGNCHVKSCSIEFDGPKVTNRITAVKFKV